MMSKPICNKCGTVLTDEPRQSRGDYRCDDCVDAYQREYIKTLRRLKREGHDSHITIGDEDGIVTK